MDELNVMNTFHYIYRREKKHFVVKVALFLLLCFIIVIDLKISRVLGFQDVTYNTFLLSVVLNTFNDVF